MSRTRVTEITIGVDAHRQGRFSAPSALHEAGITIPQAKYFEIDRRRLCEDNECYDAKVDVVQGVEFVDYERNTDADDVELLSLIITVHYD